jgi:hypothetical protein
MRLPLNTFEIATLSPFQSRFGIMAALEQAFFDCILCSLSFSFYLAAMVSSPTEWHFVVGFLRLNAFGLIGLFWLCRNRFAFISD